MPSFNQIESYELGGFENSDKQDVSGVVNFPQLSSERLLPEIIDSNDNNNLTKQAPIHKSQRENLFNLATGMVLGTFFITSCTGSFHTANSIEKALAKELNDTQVEKGSGVVSAQQSKEEYQKEEVIQEEPFYIAKLQEEQDGSKEAQEDTEIEEEIEVKELFDFSILDINQWNNFKVERIEKKDPGYVLTVNEVTPLYAIPLTLDGFFRWDKEHQEDMAIDELLLTEATSFEIAEVRTLVGPNGEAMEIGLIANTFTYKRNYVYAVLLNARDQGGSTASFAVEDKTRKSVVSYISPAETIYPNKVANVLVALKTLSQYQDNNEGLTKGNEYSALEVFGLKKAGGFGNYYMGDRDIQANGICSIATALSTLSFLNDNNVVERWGHPQTEMYHHGPFSPDSRTVDAAINIDNEGIFDFRWIQGKDGYIKIDVDVVSGEQISEDNQVPSLGFAMIVSLSYSDEKPEGQTEQITQKLEEYVQIKDLSLTSYVKEYGDVGSVKKEISQVQEALLGIYNREDFGVFGELVMNNPVLKDILQLQEVVNSYPESSDQSLAEYLRKSEWYQNYGEKFEREGEAKRLVEYAIGAVDHIRVSGQPLQCVMFAALVKHLYPELGVGYNIGGAIVQDENGAIRGVRSAAELVPSNYAGFEGRAGGIPSGGILLAGRGITLEDYNPGDSFVILGKYGHVGVILAKYIGEEGTELLIADANRFEDGRIRVFTVNESEMDTVFDLHKYIITSETNSSESFFLTDQENTEELDVFDVQEDYYTSKYMRMYLD